MSSPDTDQTAVKETLLERRQLLTEGLKSLPYDLILYLERAAIYADLGYPDLAAGDAYRALLLTDEIVNDGFEYHDQAQESLSRYIGEPLPEALVQGHLADEYPDLANGTHGDADVASGQLALLASIRAYQILSLSLLLCGCLRSASQFCDRGLAAAPQNAKLLHTRNHIDTVARQKLGLTDFDVDDLPDFGLVRREVYPWNEHEPDRFSPESLQSLNDGLREMAPKCAVQVATLPVLLEGESETDNYEIIPTCKQLGVFAQEDIEAGEVVLREYTLLTANNRHKDSVCDACSSELARLGSSENQSIQCEECFDTVFCSQECHDEAQRRYHPAVCDKDVDSIAKDPSASEADETLHLLLLARVLAMAVNEEVHPLDVQEIKFIWGDFVPSRANEINVSPNAGPPPEWTLPFSFKYNIETPLHILEKMDVDIYAGLPEYDLWVLNTLYAKFRGTASARKNPRDGRPDVAAVHPYWCLANHDCDPNVTWDWSGRMVLSARKQRIVGGRPGGIKKGEEILNHYCDVTLPVQQRREWARGSLGGWCMCQRCRTEASENKAAENGTSA